MGNTITNVRLTSGADFGDAIRRSKKSGSLLDSPDHRRVLDLASHADFQSMDSRDAVELQDYLLNALIAHSLAHDMMLKEDNSNRPLIDEEQFPDEMALLHQLLARLSVPEKMAGWLTARRHDFEHRLAQDSDFQNGLKEWPAMSLGERRRFIEEFVAKRALAYSDKDFQFAKPNILVDNGGIGLGHSSIDTNEITFDNSLFDIDYPDRALDVAMHEGTHNLLTQFAIADHNGNVKQNHPLYDDIHLTSLKKMLSTTNNGVFPSLYEADFEENLADHEGSAFTYELAHGHGLRARFKIAVQLINEALHGRPPALKQAVQMLQMK